MYYLYARLGRYIAFEDMATIICSFPHGFQQFETIGIPGGCKDSLPAFKKLRGEFEADSSRCSDNEPSRITLWT